MRTSSVHDEAPPANDGKIVLLMAVLDTSPVVRDLSRADQAKLFGLARPHYAELRAGRKTPSLPVAMRISRISKIPVEVLCGCAA